MKKTISIIAIVLIAALSVAQEKKQDPPKQTVAPVLTEQQQLALSETYNDILETQQIISSLTTQYTEAKAKQDKAVQEQQQHQTQFCNPAGGNRFTLDHSQVAPVTQKKLWTCKDTAPPAQEKK